MCLDGCEGNLVATSVDFRNQYKCTWQTAMNNTLCGNVNLCVEVLQNSRNSCCVRNSRERTESKAVSADVMDTCHLTSEYYFV